MLGALNLRSGSDLKNTAASPIHIQIHETCFLVRPVYPWHVRKTPYIPNITGIPPLD